jgi:hypothetical protein
MISFFVVILFSVILLIDVKEALSVIGHVAHLEIIYLFPTLFLKQSLKHYSVYFHVMFTFNSVYFYAQLIGLCVCI